MGTDREQRLARIIAEMRNERSLYKSHDLGYVDSVSTASVDEWADELEAALSTPAEATPKPPTPERRALQKRVRAYLGNGGLWNPEHMEHDKVRQLLVDMSAALWPQEVPMTERCTYFVNGARCGLNARHAGDCQADLCDPIARLRAGTSLPEPERPAERCVWRVAGAMRDLRTAHDDYLKDYVVESWVWCPHCGRPLSVEEDTHAS